MRRLLLAGMVLLLAAPVAATADDGFVVVGKVLAANPTSKGLPSLTERTNPCGATDGSAGDTNGLDGFWFALPEDAPGGIATLSSDAVDADVYFYRQSDGDCDLISAADDPRWSDMATDFTPNEAGIVPADASWAIVTMPIGREATFSFRLD